MIGYERRFKMIITNAQFSKSNKEFVAACEEAGIVPTRRQASKFLNKKGLTYKVMKKQIEVLRNIDGKFIKIKEK